MVYFNCTSVVHTLYMSYIMTKEFEKEKACLIIPSHVKHLVELIPNIVQLPFVKNVIVIESSDNLLENRMLKDLCFSDIDKIFVVGMERIGMWLLDQGDTYGIKAIVVEEGANVIVDINKWIEFVSTFSDVRRDKLSPKYINEIWKLNGSLQLYGVWKNVFVHDLEMQKYMHNKTFMNKLLKYINKIFKNEEEKKLPQIVFFDNYALAACKNCSRMIEKNILSKIVQIISQWDYEIKPHPNDKTEWKYEKNYSVDHNKDIPIEIIRLQNLNYNVHEKIYISYGSTGCITNEIFLLDGHPYIIFLYKILRLYQIEYPGELILKEFFNKCGDMQKNRIFVPETFVELNDILYQIIEKGKFDENKRRDLKKKEIIDNGKEVRKLYKKIFDELPDELNETSLMALAHNEWDVLAKNDILVNQNNYKIIFNIGTHDVEQKQDHDVSEIKMFRWYIAKGAIVKVNLHRIYCVNQDSDFIQNFNLEKIVWLDSEIDEKGRHIFNNCDAMVEFSIEYKTWLSVRDIVIDADIEWDLSYEALLRLRNKNLENMAQIIDQLTVDNEVREQSIQQMNGYLKDWEKEVYNRDEEIKYLTQQRDEARARSIDSMSLKQLIKHCIKRIRDIC